MGERKLLEKEGADDSIARSEGKQQQRQHRKQQQQQQQ